ncbi:MAG TPA: hypothetical protein VK518_06290 [Puia sp.]|nr:hypothetical protein [Puia sp.]
MKKINIISGLIIMAAMAGFFSCKRDMPLIDKTASPAGTARICLIDVSPNLDSVLRTNYADTFNVLFNGVKLNGYTAGTAAAMTYNAIYPFAGTTYGYASIPAGPQEIKFTKGLNTLDSVVLATFHKTLLADQYYTFMITDSVNSNRDSSKIFVKDSLLPATAGFFNMRFAHAVLNDTAGKGIDVWSTRNNKNIFTNIKPGTITGFSSFTYTANLNDTLFVRRAGTLSGLDTLSTVVFSNQRSYTLVYKGNGNSNRNADAKRRHLITYVNQ